MDDTQAALSDLCDALAHPDNVLNVAARHAYRSAIAALATAPAPAGEPVAWMTRTDEGDPAMLFFDRAEAVQYCDDGEQPTPLYEAAPAGTPSEDVRDAARWRYLRQNIVGVLNLLGGKAIATGGLTGAELDIEVDLAAQEQKHE